MKRVKIFLASSIEDLQADRLQVGDFFRQLNELYLDSGIHFSLIKCEDYDQSIADGGKQQQYDREIQESELVFFLFFRKVGEYTRHELEVALEAFRNQKKPRIVTYFKYIDTLEETVQEVRDFMNLLDQQLKHYYNTYGHIDTLKLGILMQIKLLQLDNAQIKLADGVVQLNGQPMLKAENVPLLQGNRSLQELTQKRQQLQAALTRCRSDYLADPTPEKETAFFDTSAALNRVSKQLTDAEQETMALLTTVAEMTTDGRVLTHRQKEALHHFNLGNYAAVHTILECEERENELRRAQQRSENAKQEIQGYVEEELLLIETKKAQGLTPSHVEQVLLSYEKITELVQQQNLDKRPLFKYAKFLHQQNRHDQAIAVAKKLSWYYESPDAVVEDTSKGHLYNLLGNLSSELQHYSDAQLFHKKALDIRIRLAEKNPAAYEANLAASYNNLGNLYHRTQNLPEAEAAYNHALDILTRLAAQNPTVYEPDLAMSYNNLGTLYGSIQRYPEAEDFLKKSLDIRTRLAQRNPKVYEPDLAMSYNNLGSFLCKILQPENGKPFLQKATQLRARLAAQNPDAYEPDFADSCINLGNLYASIPGCDVDAEAAYKHALIIYTRLAKREPAAYEPALAINYNNLGALYRQIRNFSEAEAAYNKALEIRARLANENPAVYEPALAASYHNLATLYCETQRYEEAEPPYQKALEIQNRFAAQNPDAYEPEQATFFHNFGLMYFDTQRYTQGESAFKQALDIRLRLARQHPEVYEPALADTYMRLGLLLAANQQRESCLEIFRAALPILERLEQKHPGDYSARLALIRTILEKA